MRPIKPILFILLFISYCFIGHAQTSHSCGTHEYKNSEESIEVEKAISGFYNRVNRRTNNEDTITLPVVFHIVHFAYDTVIGQGSNVHDSLVFRALEEGNNVLRNRNSAFHSDNLDLNIQLKMASITPCGKPFNGINRIAGSSQNNPNLAELNTFDSKNYINIYIVNSIRISLPLNVAGLSSYPYNHGTQQDVIYLVNYYLSDTTFIRYLMAHELGHYFGLMHTFDNGCKNDTCSINGDRVCDTPPDGIQNSQSGIYVCDTLINSCNTDEDDTTTQNPFRAISLGGLGDQNDLRYNIMDYISSGCRRSFTPGQKERMRAVVNTTRSSLKTSTAWDTPCPVVICPSFDNSRYQYPGDNIFMQDNQFITFTNTTTTGNKYKWYFKGKLYSTDTAFTWVADTVGDLEIKLCVLDSNSGCTNCISKTLRISCSSNPFMAPIPDTANMGDTIDLKWGAGFNPINPSYFWYVNDSLISTNQNTKHVFHETGWNYIKYELGNGKCSKFRLDSIYILCTENLDFNFINNLDSVTINEEITIQFSSSIDSNKLNFNITNGIITSRTDSTIVVKFTQVGDQQVIANSMTCQDSTVGIFKLFVKEGISSINEVIHSNFKIYPNPTRNVIKIDTKYKNYYEIRVLDLNGRTIMNKNMVGNNKISISSLPIGFYTFVIESNGSLLYTKLVKI